LIHSLPLSTKAGIGHRVLVLIYDEARIVAYDNKGCVAKAEDGRFIVAEWKHVGSYITGLADEREF
jgi:hypothetical protein